MATKINILFTGATGYIGGSVLARFLQRSDVASFKLTALVRSPEKAAKLKALSVNAVIGSHSDTTLMESLAADSDVIFAMADVDNLEAAVATLKGLKKRHETTGQVPILIHTSGTGLLVDKAVGDYTTDLIYDDTNYDQMESLALRRNVDLSIVSADQEGYVQSYIILPSTVYGIATGILVENGIQNPHSQQVPALVKSSLDRGRGSMVGAGKNLWPDVNVEDVADLYLVLFDAIRNDPRTGHGREGFYFGENGEHSMYEVGKAIGVALVALGKSDNPEPTSYSNEELDKYFGGMPKYLGSNSRARANHSRAIGWKPVKTKADFLASIKPEVEVFAAKLSKA